MGVDWDACACMEPAASSHARSLTSHYLTENPLIPHSVSIPSCSFAWTAHPLLKAPIDHVGREYARQRAREAETLGGGAGSGGILPNMDMTIAETEGEDEVAAVGDGSTGGTGEQQYFRHEDDAFHTVLQWLYGRLPYTRGHNVVAPGLYGSY